MEYRIALKKGVWDNVKKIKGWKSDAEASRALNFTRSYISMVTKAKAGCSSIFMTRLASSLGSADSKWYTLFEMIPRGNFPDSHPAFNQEKELGIIPYERFSSCANIRSNDYPTETKNFTLAVDKP
jgi:hypothetical protein